MTAADPSPSAGSTSQTRFALGEVRRTLTGTMAAAARPVRPAVGAARSILGPALGVISPLGRLVAVATVVAFVVAGVLHWAEFTFVGATLGAALVVAAAFAIGRSTYAVTIELNPRRVVAGDRALGRMTVTNDGSRSVLPTRMELPVGSGLAEFVVQRLAPGESAEELFAVPTSRRALILAGPAVSVRGDQLGLLRRTVTWTEQIELFVHPRTTRLRATARGLVKDLEGQTTKVITVSDLAFHALRTYEQGDDIRNVHWRTSARTGQLMVRQYEETRRSQLLLLHSAERTHYATDDEFELGVSVMASIACQVINEESALDVASDRGRLRAHTRTALLDDSCRIEPAMRTHPSLREFARVSGARLRRPSLVVLVVGSGAPVSELRSASTLYGVDTEVVCLRVDQAGEPRITKIGDVVLATVTKLSDLPGLLERASR